MHRSQPRRFVFFPGRCRDPIYRIDLICQRQCGHPAGDAGGTSDRLSSALRPLPMDRRQRLALPLCADSCRICHASWCALCGHVDLPDW